MCPGRNSCSCCCCSRRRRRSRRTQQHIAKAAATIENDTVNVRGKVKGKVVKVKGKVGNVNVNVNVNVVTLSTSNAGGDDADDADPSDHPAAAAVAGARSRWRIGPRHRPARRAKFTHKFIPIPRGYSHRRVSTSKGISFVRWRSKSCPSDIGFSPGRGPDEADGRIHVCRRPEAGAS